MKKTKQTYHQLENKLKSLEKENSFLKLNQKIFDASPAYVVLIGPDGKVLSMNDSMLQTIGYTIAEVLGKDYIETFIPVQDRPKLIALFAKHAVVEETAQNINRLLKKNGGTVTVEWHGTPFFDKEKNLHAYLGIGIDITDKIETEKLSKKSTIQLETIVNNYPGGSITLIDKDLKIFFTGGTGYRKHNLDPKIFVGKHLKHAFVPEISEINMAYLQKCLNGEISEFIVEYEQAYYKNYTYPIVLNNKIEYALLISNDISDLKTQEKDLLKTLQEQNLILKNDPAFIIFKDCKNNILRISETVAKMTGLPMHEIEGKPSKEIYPDMADKYYVDDLEVMKSGKPKRGIIEPLITVDGEQKWLLTDKIPYRNSKGEVAGIIVFSSDITDIKKTELALVEAKEKAEESEARFRNLMEGIDAIAVQGYSPDGITQFWNNASEKLYGYTREEAIGSNLLDLIIPSEMKDMVAAAIHEMAETGEPIPSGELALKHKDGSPVPVISHHAIVKVPGRAQELFCLDIDIAKSKKAEEALRMNEDLLNASQRLSKTGGWAWNVEKNAMHWTDEAYRIHDFTPGEIEPGSAEHISMSSECYRPEDRALILEAFQRCMEEGQPYDLEFPFKTIKGRQLWIRTAAQPVIENGKTTMIIGNIVDITQRKLAEIEIENSKELLSDLNKRLESARENERAVISRDIHDQLGQSLTALKIDLVSLQAKMKTESQEADTMGGMIRMVNSISRDVQRISSDLRPLMLDDLGLASTLEWYCEEFAGRTGLKVELDIEATQSDCINRDLALYRVAQESLTNIIRHANAGMVKVSLHKINDNLVLTIQDDGIGISPDKIGSNKSLGLLGMSERVKQYDGKIEIQTKEKSGTIIRAIIPIT